MVHQSNHEKGNIPLSVSFSENSTSYSVTNQTEWIDYTKTSNSTEDGNQVNPSPRPDRAQKIAARLSGQFGTR